MEKIKVEVSTIRNNHNEINLKINCVESGARFLNITLTPEQFGMLVTGSGIDAEAVVRGADVIGKKKIREKRVIFCPLDTCDRQKLREWLEENGKEDGWKVDSYLGSQTSIVRDNINNGYMLHYAVYRYE